MDLPVLLLYLLVCPAGLILFAIVLLYSIPVRFFIRFCSDAVRQELEIVVRWGIISIRSTTQAGRSHTALLIFRHPLFSSEGGTDKVTERAPSSPAHRPAGISTAQDLIPVIRSLACPTIRIGRVLFRMSRFERCEGTVRIGLGDPAATGMLYGSYWATRFAFLASRIYVDMEPVFDQETFQIVLSVRARIDHPLRILVQALRELVRPEVRAGIAALRHGTGEVS
jgi:hypothetical protein